MCNCLDPKLDVVFKLLFTRKGSEPLLISLLEAVLHPAQPIVSVTVLNPELDKTQVSDRGVVLDIRARLFDGSQANVEMQMSPRPGMRKRQLYHWSRMYSSQLVRGDQYKTLRRCVSVFILAYDELPSDRFHAKFVLREVHDEEVLTDQIELHLVQLRHTPGESEDERQLVGWGRFLMADSDEEREAVAMTDPMLAKANEALGELSADPEARRLAADREEAFLLGRFELQEAREEGAEQGQRKLLLKQASLRFGMLPEHIVQRIESANGDELLRWGEAVLTDSVDDWCALIEGKRSTKHR